MTTLDTALSLDRESLRRALLPGGHGRSSLAVDDRAPYARRAEGYIVEDFDGNRLVDVNNSMTVNLHGNAHPAIIAAVEERLRDGLVSLGVANVDELVLARELVNRLEWAEQVRFSNTGSEAVQLAARVARARTGRDRIIATSLGYHGTTDVALPVMGAHGVRGVPAAVAEQTVTVPRNDIDALEAAFAAHDGDVAAVLLDLCANGGGMVALTPEFVDRAVALARATGALVIVDEVVTFRTAVGGLASVYGLRPDIMVLGKTIGGGFPIGAIVGTRDALSPLDASGYGLEHGGTFTANPLSMAAGSVAMELFDEAAVTRLNGLSARLEDALTPELVGTGWEIRRSGSVFRLFPAAWMPDVRKKAQKALYWAAYERGILTTGTGLSCLSTVMDESVVDTIATGFAAAARAVTP
jgi:glutamate-1-semialdehyde 2,1-aminomutase